MASLGLKKIENSVILCLLVELMRYRKKHAKPKGKVQKFDRRARRGHSKTELQLMPEAEKEIGKSSVQKKVIAE